MNMLTLKKIDRNNIWKIISLEVNENQRDFVATNTESLLEAYTVITSGGVALPFGIYADDNPVGFVMLGYDELPGEENPEIAKGNYSLWRFMIDKKYQRMGYGKEAMRLVLDYIRSFPCGPAEYCFLSYEPENKAAKKLYNSFGFRENGELDGEEVVAVLPLK